MKMNLFDAIRRLYGQYGGRRGPWGQHPEYMLDMWQTLVGVGDTQLGYWPWVVLHILIETPETHYCLERELQLALPEPDLLALEVDEDEEATLDDAGYPKTEDGYAGEHDEYPLWHWVEDVENDDTRRGYWSWVAKKIEEASWDDDEDDE